MSKVACPTCGHEVSVNKDGTLRIHLRRNRNGARLNVKCPPASVEET